MDKVVQSSVEGPLKALLDAGADPICLAVRHEHSPERVDRRAGFYERKWGTRVETR
jgi:putative transposase